LSRDKRGTVQQADGWKGQADNEGNPPCVYVICLHYIYSTGETLIQAFA